MSGGKSDRLEVARLRLEAIKKAKTDLLTFARLMKPVAGNESDPRLSTYEAAKHHVYLAKKLEEVAAGKVRRLIVNMPPRSGKTELSSKVFPAWMAGRFPDKSLILATYNERFSYDFGRAVRGFMKHPAYKQIFPDAKPKSGAMAANRLEMTGGGLLVFTGVSGSLTGRGGDCFPAETIVETQGGGVRIADIRKGVLVLSYDERENRIFYRRVEAVIEREAAPLVRLTTAKGRSVECTADHKFYADGEWIAASELKPGSKLVGALTDKGDELGLVDRTQWFGIPLKGVFATPSPDTVVSVEDAGRSAVVYDIQVEEHHNFFANGILAHNCIICDDLIKDRQQADSQLERDKMWVWFQQVLKSRLMTDRGSIMIITTRWHPDDIVGRLTDQTNSYYDKDEADQWEVIDLPAFAVEGDPLGRKPGEVLWPSRFGEDFLENMRRGDPRGFSALYQCRPSPEEGAYFQLDWLEEYRPNDLPSNLRYYISTDFAVSSASNRDKTCIMPVGIDDKQNIWIMPDVWWHHGTSEQVVEAFVNLVAKYRPLMVWGEKGQIAKSLGPFIRKRMMERGAFAPIDETHPAADKQARAQSIAGRMAMHKVRFPVYAPWWPSAKDQVLKFPQVAHDDFVDALALIGMGLMKLHVPKGSRETTGDLRPGTFGWMKEQTRRQNRMISMAQNSEGW